jgi:hypothetical protein
MPSKYANFLPCEMIAKKALVVGTPPRGLRAEELRVVKFRTIGEWYRALKNLGELLGEL